MSGVDVSRDRASRWVLVWIVLLLAVPIAVFAWGRIHDTNADVLMRDATAAAHVPYFYGYVSTVGVLMWGATAGICLLAALALRGTAFAGVFFGTSFVLTAMLGLDDALLWHEEFFPARGIPEAVVYGLYGLAFLGWLIVNRRFLFAKLDWVLGLSLAFFAASVSLDFYERVFSPLANQVIIEDGAKFVGIGLWLAYFLVAGWSHLRPEVDEHAARAAGPTGS